MTEMSDPLHLVGAEADVHAEAPSFEEFFEAEKIRLYRALCLVTRNRFEAEELTQEAFVQVLGRWDRAELADPTAYLYRTALNAFRKGHRRAMLAAKRAVGITPPDDELAAIDELDAAARALAVLTPRQRAAVILVDLLGFTSEEAGRILGLRSGTIRTHLARGHAVLRETITS